MLQYTSTQNTDEAWGTLAAVDFAARTDEPLSGGVVATAGGLVFSGAGKGVFPAFDAGSGRRLWSYQRDAGVNALFGFKQGAMVMAFGLPP